MPVNAASHSIHLPDEVAEHHDVQFLVHSQLVIPDASQLEPHLDDHLGFLKALRTRGVFSMGGPFFTPDGKNTGNGFYVLRTDNLEEARRITAEDPLHKAGLRKPTIEPWLQVVD